MVPQELLIQRAIEPLHMGIHLGRLSMAESQKLQDFLLPLISGN